MKLFTSILPIILLGLGLISSCSHPEKSRYQEWADREIASGVRHDSLFLSLEIGMSRQAFIDTCWQLNRRQLISNGPRSESVQHVLPNISPTTTINFYPDFNSDGRINQVPVLLARKVWAPWLPATSSDSLMPVVRDLFLDWYGGNDWQRFHFEGLKPMWIKIDGNRRIALTREDEQHVKALITDLTAIDPEKDKLFIPPQLPIATQTK